MVRQGMRIRDDGMQEQSKTRRMAERVKAPTSDSQTVRLRVRVRCSAMADTCLSWNAWRHSVFHATQRPTKDPLVGKITMRQ